MATHDFEPGAGEKGTTAFVLTPEEVDTVNIDGDGDKLEVIKEVSDDAVWWTTDGSDPGIDDPGSYYLPASAVCRDSRGTKATTQLKFTSLSAATIRVQRKD